MVGLIIIFFFVILMAIPGFYIITRKIFPKMSKRVVAWISCVLTLLFVLALSLLVWTA